MSTAMPSAPKRPNRIRFSFFVFLGVYPLVTALVYGLAPLTSDWQIWQRNLVMVPMIVLSMVFVIIPRIHRHCHRWL
jgi:antibiotic biosynthesis monooxygenase (ABM) superfamily enzyme